MSVRLPKPASVVVVGQGAFAAAALDVLLNRNHQVALVVAPVQRRGRPDAAWVWARRHGVAALAPRLLCPARVPACDLIVAAHAHVLIGAGVRARAALGAIGYHPSFLPLHRGRDAVRWTVHMRDVLAGGTVYQLDDGLDTGPVLAQEAVVVGAGATASSLWREKLFPLGLALLRRVLQDLENGLAKPRPQAAGGTYEPPYPAA